MACLVQIPIFNCRKTIRIRAFMMKEKVGILSSIHAKHYQITLVSKIATQKRSLGNK